MEFAKVARGNRKAKKKPVKDELDRMKLAEKKKRRLEKALAASAAICAELEKKKLKKKEEQEKLYEEGASIAEAVALQVLLGEDSDDSSHVMLQKEHVLIPSWDHLNGTNIVAKRRLPQYSCYNNLSPHASENVEICSGPRQFGHMWSNYNAVASSDHSGRGFHQPYFEGDARWGNIGVSVDHVTTARAFSSLKICDNTAMTDACAYSRVLRGSN